MSSFSDEELAEFKEIFGYFITNKEKELMSSDDLGTILRGLGRNPLESELEEMIKEHGSDEMDFATFLTCMEKPLKEKKQHKDKDILESFAVFDPDGSGKIDKHELRKIMCELGEGMGPKEFEFFLGEADPEGSGSIDYAAFIERMSKSKKEKDDI